MKIVKFVLPVVAVGFAASSAMAAPAAADWAVDGANTIPGTVANAATVDGEGQDFLSAALVIELTQGSIYNVPVADGDRPQPGLWVVPGFETHRWDTWIGMINGVNDVGPTDAGDLGVFATSLTGQLFAATWGGTGTETSLTQIANITLTDDAEGTWRMLTGFGTEAENVLFSSEGPVVGGALVPEPASLALLGLGGLAVLRRR